MSAHDTESIRSGAGRQARGSNIDGSEMDDQRSSAGGSHVGQQGRKSAAAATKGETVEVVELPAEVMAELVQAFCRDTRCEQTSAAADKFRNSLITNAGDSAVKLRNSRLGMHSGVAMGKALKSHPLATLDLHGNVLRDVGAIALVALLRGHDTLRHIFLGSNDLGVEAALAFARELATNNRLLTLELGNDVAAGASMYNNRFNAAVGVAFGNALEHNATLTTLGLAGVSLGKMHDDQADDDSQAHARPSETRSKLDESARIQARPHARWYGRVTRRGKGKEQRRGRGTCRQEIEPNAPAPQHALLGAGTLPAPRPADGAAPARRPPLRSSRRCASTRRCASSGWAVTPSARQAAS